MKKTERKKSNKLIYTLALSIAILSVSIGFLVISKQIKIQTNLTTHHNVLDYKIVFSSKSNGEQKTPIVPTIIGNGATADNAVIINSVNPLITNLNVNFTEPGQKVKYNFYVYNKGDYTGYLNRIMFDNIGKTYNSKLCITQDGRVNESILKACDKVRLYVKVGNVITNKSLYDINGKYLRPRTAHPVEVTIEYLDNNIELYQPFDVFFGDIHLHYSIYDNNHIVERT